jgi:hypothetical protein
MSGALAAMPQLAICCLTVRSRRLDKSSRGIPPERWYSSSRLYAIFATGCVLEILGFAGTGLVASIPGGLFEIFFGIWLIAKGFNPLAITIGAANTAGVVTP